MTPRMRATSIDFWGNEILLHDAQMNNLQTPLNKTVSKTCKVNRLHVSSLEGG